MSVIKNKLRNIISKFKNAIDNLWPFNNNSSRNTRRSSTARAPQVQEPNFRSRNFQPVFERPFGLSAAPSVSVMNFENGSADFSETEDEEDLFYHSRDSVLEPTFHTTWGPRSNTMIGHDVVEFPQPNIPTLLVPISSVFGMSFENLEKNLNETEDEQQQRFYPAKKTVPEPTWGSRSNTMLRPAFTALPQPNLPFLLVPEPSDSTSINVLLHSDAALSQPTQSAMIPEPTFQLLRVPEPTTPKPMVPEPLVFVPEIPMHVNAAVPKLVVPRRRRVIERKPYITRSLCKQHGFCVFNHRHIDFLRDIVHYQHGQFIITVNGA